MVTIPLFKDLKLLKLPDILESEVMRVFCIFSRNELPKSVCGQFNLVHEVHTRDTTLLAIRQKSREPSFWK